MDTKKIPSLIMLLGCSVAAIASYINHYTLQKMLTTILWVLIVFYILGIVVKVLFDKYIPVVEENNELEDGSVIEKQVDDVETEGYTESEEDAEGSFMEVEPSEDVSSES